MTACLQCVPGQYQNQEEQRNCTLCASGRASPVAKLPNDCNPCSEGRYQQEVGMTACLQCVPGQYQDQKEQHGCEFCPIGKFRSSEMDLTCELCPMGYTAIFSGQASCQKCGAGKAGRGCDPCKPGKYRGNDNSELVCIECSPGLYQEENGSPFCLKCAVGTYTDKHGSNACDDCHVSTFQENRGKSNCEACLAGQYSAELGQSACQECDAGTYVVSNLFCEQCSAGLFKKEKKGTECLSCRKGKVPNLQRTDCEDPRWTLQEDCAKGEYFNSTDPDLTLWSCVQCPHGANCWQFEERTALHWRDVVALQGFWRVPWSHADWSETPVDFISCSYEEDCIGWTLSTPNVTEGCLVGTRGPLCSVCITGYNRDVRTCNLCPQAAFEARVGALLGILFVLISIVVYFRKRIETKWRKYKSLSGDLLRVFSINVTFAQINSSMTSVIEIPWPTNWHNFVGHFNFVNIDVMSLVGANCISNFDYYGSFSFMVCLPVVIFVATIVSYTCSVAASKHKLNRLTKQEETDLHREALRKLFEFAGTFFKEPTLFLTRRVDNMCYMTKLLHSVIPSSVLSFIIRSFVFPSFVFPSLSHTLRSYRLGPFWEN